MALGLGGFAKPLSKPMLNGRVKGREWHVTSICMDGGVDRLILVERVAQPTPSVPKMAETPAPCFITVGTGRKQSWERRRTITCSRPQLDWRFRGSSGYDIPKTGRVFRSLQ